MSRLDARYRLLLRAYPPGRRRAELLDTLMEAAPASRHIPTLREAANLLRHGLRARLGRPAGRGIVVVAAFVALIAGFLGASVAARVAWEFAPDHPSGAALAEIKATVFPGLPAEAARNGDGLFFDPSERSYAGVALYGHSEDFEFSTLILFPTGRFISGSYRSWTAAAQDRLVAAGWQVSDAEVTGPTSIATGEVDDTGRTFTATRDGRALKVETTTDVVDTPAGSFDVTARLDRLTPGYVTAAAVLGLLSGALVGWLLTGWASRRTEHAAPSIRALARLSTIVALVLLLPQALFGVLLLGTATFAAGPPVQPFWSLSLTYGYGCGFLGVLLFAVALASAAVARPGSDSLGAIG
ncbi:hypothetical protein ACQPZX_26620 [Actinoplanes sp. CA-142083]|uniref:hypothetical protein n=1 Tax=Actinoplanes sp. CA-142083 TaxID=3239903 RepID=UPI003D8D26E8